VRRVLTWGQLLIYSNWFHPLGGSYMLGPRE